MQHGGENPQWSGVGAGRRCLGEIGKRKRLPFQSLLLLHWSPRLLPTVSLRNVAIRKLHEPRAVCWSCSIQREAGRRGCLSRCSNSEWTLEGGQSPSFFAKTTTRARSERATEGGGGRAASHLSGFPTQPSTGHLGLTLRSLDGCKGMMVGNISKNRVKQGFARSDLRLALPGL